MHIFLSWSGDYSKSYAAAFKKFLENVIQTVEVYISTDNKKGRSWYEQIIENLNKTDFMITILTKENQSTPWLNFEAGAVASRGKRKFCSAILIDLKADEIRGPLINLHHTNNNKGDIKSLIQQMNLATNDKPLIKESILSNSFEKFWEDFVKELEQIQIDDLKSKTMSTEDKLDDLSISMENQYYFLKEEIKNSTRLLFLSKHTSFIEESFQDEKIELISKRQAEIIRLYFGIDRMHSLSFEEIGDRFAITDLEVVELMVKGIIELKKKQ